MKTSYIIWILHIGLFASCALSDGNNSQEKTIDPANNPVNPESEESKADICKDVTINSESVTVCFPEGKKCIDFHGDGAGNPRAYDCWDGGSRACYIGY